MIDVDDLVCLYPGRPPVRAVSGIDMRIPPEGATGLVGESGSGKSTVARAIVGLVPATAGSVTVDGQLVDASRRARLAKVRRLVQLVFQNPHSSFNPRMTVGMALAEAIAVAAGGGLRDAATKREMARLLELVGIPSSAAGRYPHQFSGGQLQRIAIARGLASQARYLILDEVTAALDVSVQANILTLLRDLQQEVDVSYLLISHDLAVVRYLTQRVYVMRRGEVVEAGTCESVFARPSHEYTRALLKAVPRLGGHRWRQARGRRAASGGGK